MGLTMDFIIKKDKKLINNMLKQFNVLVPVEEKYSLGFYLQSREVGYYVIEIYLIINENLSMVHRSNSIYSKDVSKIKNLLCLSGDRFWNEGLEAYRKEIAKKPQERPLSPQEQEIKEAKEEILEYKGINGVDYAKIFPYKERRLLKKMGYYKHVGGCYHSFFEKILDRATNGERISFKKMLILFNGFLDYYDNISDDILYYSQPFLSDEVMEELYELSKLDSKTDNKLLNMKEMIEKEKKDYNRICEITANKKKENINSLLETEKLKYMINNGIPLAEAFYYIDKDAQNKKENILKCYLSVVNNDDLSSYKKDIIYIAKYLNDNVEKRDVETIIDYTLINDEGIIDQTKINEDNLNHISFLKLKLKGGKE